MQADSFGRWLRLKRKALDLTREGLANRVGCAAATIRKIETEERRPSAQIVERMAEIFEIPNLERPAFLRYARGNWASAPPEILEELPWRREKLFSRSNIPATTTSFVGREQDIRIVCDYLSNPEIRLVTLIGPPGIGKTRLSVETARVLQDDFPDGVFFVTLAQLDTGDRIKLTIAQVLGYVETDDLSASTQLVNYMGEREILLVLDNCEHLIEDVAPLVSDLLSTCPRLKILITSREALRVSGEWLYSVPALGMPKENLAEMEIISGFPALRLFTERARAVHSGFDLTPDNIRAIASICKQLDGLPLAIELIAARVRSMSPQVLLERLTEQYVLSADGMRAIPARQKTLNNAIGWSYNLLSQDEQKSLAWLSVFSGGFSLGAAETLFQGVFSGKSVSDLIISLSDKSLLQRAVDKCGEFRFTMLVTIRYFASNRLQSMGEETMARNRHLESFLDFAERGDKEIRGPDQAEWADMLENELDNFHSALEWALFSCQTESALRLLCALGWPWEVRGHYLEARNWLEQIRILPDVNQFPVVYASLLNHIGRHTWIEGNSQEAHQLLEESLAISSQGGIRRERNRAETLNWLGLILHLSNRDFKGAKSFFERALALSRKLDDKHRIALSTFHLGVLEGDLDNDSLALSLLEQSLAIFRQLGDLFFVARVSIFLGYFFMRSGNDFEAYQSFKQQLQIDLDLQYWDGIADGWRNLGNYYRHRDDYDLASQCYEQSLLVANEHALYTYDSFYLLGLSALHQEDQDVVTQRFTRLFDLAKKTEDRVGVSILLMGLAIASIQRDELPRAARLYGAATAIRETSNRQYPPHDQDEFDRQVKILGQQLGETEFNTLQTEGRTMTIYQAIEYSLQKE